MKSDRFYLTSPHGGCGSNAMFHADGGGYVTDIDKAEIITRAEAQDLVDKGHLRHSNSYELPLCAELVDQASAWKVDHQYVNQAWPEFTDRNNEYVLMRKGSYDGNDVPFVSINGYSSFDYSLAKAYTLQEIKRITLSGYKVVPKSHTDEIARRTFQTCDINRRAMISGAGIVGLRKKRRSTATGKTRMNCPCCGRIAWQWNPYEFETCSNIKCDNFLL